MTAYSAHQRLFKGTASRGTSLVFFTVFIIVLLGFTGIAIYLGLTTHFQNELQKAASTAASVGATALYDRSSADGVPQRSSDLALTAARQVFNNIRAQSPTLQAFQTAGASFSTQGDRVRVRANAIAPTAFFRPLGINEVDVQANVTAQYLKQVLEVPAISTLAGQQHYAMVNLAAPLVDGPGSDLYIAAQPPYHGYSVEVCSGSNCYDVTGGAKTQGGAIFNYTFPSTRRIIYGPAYIDLAATSATYGGEVRKATRVKIVDDGVHDQFQGGQRFIELALQPTRVGPVEVFHHGGLCGNNGNCSATLPTNMRPGAPGGG